MGGLQSSPLRWFDAGVECCRRCRGRCRCCCRFVFVSVSVVVVVVVVTVVVAVVVIHIIREIVVLNLLERNAQTNAILKTC